MSSSPSPKKSGLVGARREKSTTLYLANVYRGKMSDEEVRQAVRDYADMVKIRVMNIEIVFNRYCQDVVGCRIKVPISCVESAMDEDTWPDEIKCRKWENKRHNNTQ